MNDTSKAILRALAQKPMTIDELTAALGTPRPSVAGSLMSLNGRTPRLVCRVDERERKPHRYKLTTEGAEQATVV